MKKIHFTASTSLKAQSYIDKLQKLYPQSALEDADIIVVLGGDGFMLQSLHRLSTLQKPLYGLHCGTVGFLMNEIKEDVLHRLPERLNHAIETPLHPLEAHITTYMGEEKKLFAVNEVSLFRQVYQACHLNIAVDGIQRLSPLIGDGVLVATPAGSTAYNFSAHGPIIPLGTPLFALTPLNPFHPRHWRGAIIPQTACITVDVLEPEHRCVQVTADFLTVNHVSHVKIQNNSSITFRLLFDPGHQLEERILNEQFDHLSRVT